jgi:integrase
MSPKARTKHPELPPKMVKRSWKTKKGVKSAYYYQHNENEFGKRELEVLGTDLAKAKQKWGEIEGVKVDIYVESSLGDIYRQYMKWANNREVSGLAIRTITDRANYWKHLGPVFSHININQFETSWFHDYFEKRSSKIGAKKEIKFVSVMFTWSKARGKCKIANPVTGTTRLMKVKETRDILVLDREYITVRDCAAPALQNLMDALYITGARPSEPILFKFSDETSHGELLYGQKKTDVKKRMAITGDLRKLIDNRKKLLKSIKVRLIDPPILFDDHGKKLKLSGNVRDMFDAARDKAQEIDPTIRRFQLRDIRPYAATEKFRQEGIEATRKFLGHTTEAQTVKYIRGYLGEVTQALETPKKAEEEKVKSDLRESS